MMLREEVLPIEPQPCQVGVMSRNSGSSSPHLVLSLLRKGWLDGAGRTMRRGLKGQQERVEKKEVWGHHRGRK